MLENEISVQCDPDPATWKGLIDGAHGNLFGSSLHSWRSLISAQLGIPNDRPVIVVGHQPTVFHTGILAKFIAGDILARQLDGLLVHLVVDHHKGDVGLIDIPTEEEGCWHVQQTRIATVEQTTAMLNQPRITPTRHLEDLAEALQNAQGNNAAMQFAHAMNEMMQPYASIDMCIATSDLMKTDFTHAVLDHMKKTSEQCIESYNTSVQDTPQCRIRPLRTDELPLWSGPTNNRATIDDRDLRPRALLLTLLARVGLAHLFIHGTGGFAYDKAMERWSRDWLCVEPCASTMMTASVRMDVTSQMQNAPLSRELTLKKQSLVRAIKEAPYQSEERAARFQALQVWLDKHGVRQHQNALTHQNKLATKRDWIFPLFSKETLFSLRKEIECHMVTKDCVVAK